MEITNTFYPSNISEWRQWLEQNHSTAREIWLIYYKKQSGKPTVLYEEAVCEAICYGWIDSIIQKLDDERYAQKYTPRSVKTKWSEVNLNRATKLLAEGRMQSMGLEKLGNKIHALNQPDVQSIRKFEIPEWMEAAVRENPAAWEFYCQLSPSKKRLYMGWVASAKQEETRQRRLVEVISKLEKKEPLGQK